MRYVGADVGDKIIFLRPVAIPEVRGLSAVNSIRTIDLMFLKPYFQGVTRRNAAPCCFGNPTMERCSIDRGARRLLLASGSSLDYGHLVLATGAGNRLLDLPNANLEDVRYLRILDESEALRQRMASARHVVVIGAGFIGLEFAATARAKGLEVDGSNSERASWPAR